ncbi:hypothetical protein AA313_de0209555 [Arthrobotrys entomopaga]|nr:hypothetical protein AA313_de0209555 [Arthrobotrys entomopaga]
MSEKDIEERLRSHAKAFDSLLNLIPAKLYFTQDNSDQWKKRKQTKEESQAAKRAKLDPDQPVTVKEVEEERARVRSEREEKRRKLNEDGVAYETKSQMKARKKEEKRRERREKKKLEPKAQRGEKKTQVQDIDEDKDEDESEEEEEEATSVVAQETKKAQKKASKLVESPNKEQHHPAKRKEIKPNGVQLRVNGTQNTGKAEIQKPKSQPTKPTNTKEQSDDGDSGGEEEDGISEDSHKMAQDDSDPEDMEEDNVSNDGSEAEDSIQPITGLTSTMDEDTNASPAPSNTTDTSTAQKSLAEKLKNSKDPAVQRQLKERLAKRIEELRQARKADGGEAPRTRTELMDQRRKRDELRKERKKQMRLQAKVEAAKAQESATDLKPNGVSKASAAPANYSFGQVSFDDGDKLNSNLDAIKTAKKKRGPVDVLGALKQVEAKKTRLASMSDDKRADIQEKDRWSKALKMAAGEKLQDDEGLLKKSLKRQEKAKKKSEREW